MKRGFTLIELLITIAIISLLMSILMPALARARKQARAVVCQMNLHQWGLIFSMYLGDSDGKFFQGYTGPTTTEENDMWTGALRPYYSKDPEIQCCPLADKPRTEADGSPGPGANRSVTFSAWGKLYEPLPKWYRKGDYGSYGMNGWLYNPSPTTWVSDALDISKHWRTANLKGAKRIPLFLDSQWLGGRPKHRDTPPQYEGQPWEENPPNCMNRFCLNRHEGVVNGLFLDSSVRKVGLKQLWRLKWHRNWNPDNEPAPKWPDWMRKFKDY